MLFFDLRRKITKLLQKKNRFNTMASPVALPSWIDARRQYILLVCVWFVFNHLYYFSVAFTLIICTHLILWECVNGLVAMPGECFSFIKLSFVRSFVPSFVRLFIHSFATEKHHIISRTPHQRTLAHCQSWKNMPLSRVNSFRPF